MLELYQTEWCPASHRVRQRLTELGVDFIARQVPVERSERLALLERVGVSSIPVLVVDDDFPVVGEAAIEGYLALRFETPPGAEEHQARASRARRRELEEAGCL
jgi:glutathione S-transferase